MDKEFWRFSMVQSRWWSSAALALFCSCGSKAKDCFPNLERCDGTCVDLTSDRNHCGTCEIECFAGQDCLAGVCSACQNECMLGVLSCDPVENKIRVCGDSDGDTCLEWWPSTVCASGTRCEGGACVPDWG